MMFTLQLCNVCVLYIIYAAFAHEKGKSYGSIPNN